MMMQASLQEKDVDDGKECQITRCDMNILPISVFLIPMYILGRYYSNILDNYHLFRKYVPPLPHYLHHLPTSIP